MKNEEFESEGHLTAGKKCIYCDGLVVIDDGAVPELDNEMAWTILATDHAPDCEWILTRAHRRLKD